jgi:hypothetical protein
MVIRVEYENGLAGEPEPAVVWFGGRRVAVRAIVDRWYGSDRRWWGWRGGCVTLLLHAAMATALLAKVGHAQPQGLTSALVTRSGDAVIFTGRIDARAAADFMRLVREPGVARLVITSQGGIVSAALDMAEAVHERQLEVEVPSTCHSSCANYIFPAGARKVIGRPDAVAWHGNMAHVLHRQETGQASWSEAAIEDARQLAAREARFFRRMAVDGFLCWFAKLEPYSVPGSYYLSTDDLARFGVRDVTVREPSPDAPLGGDPRHVRVDWDQLDELRASVRLAR